MFNFFKKKKQTTELPKKPIYKQNHSARTIIIICPYCNTELREVYCMKINEIVIERCDYCGKQIIM